MRLAAAGIYGFKLNKEGGQTKADLQSDLKKMQGLGAHRTAEEEDPAAENSTGGLGQAAGRDIDDLDIAHHKGKPEDAEPDLVPSEGQTLYPTHEEG